MRVVLIGLSNASTRRVRHHSAPIPCTGTLAENQVRLSFQEPRLRVAPGQVVSLYVGQECLGGGVVLEHQ